MDTIVSNPKTPYGILYRIRLRLSHSVRMDNQKNVEPQGHPRTETTETTVLSNNGCYVLDASPDIHPNVDIRKRQTERQWKYNRILR